MSKKLKIFLIVLLIFIGLSALFFILKRSAGKSEVISTINEDQLTVINYSKSDRDLFDNFLRENISTISPEPEVLGGTFYVTDVIWQSNNEGIVAYEDGHIAFKAQFRFSLLNSQSKEVQLDSFVIIPF